MLKGISLSIGLLIANCLPENTMPFEILCRRLQILRFVGPKLSHTVFQFFLSILFLDSNYIFHKCITGPNKLKYLDMPPFLGLLPFSHSLSTNNIRAFFSFLFQITHAFNTFWHYKLLTFPQLLWKKETS